MGQEKCNIYIDESGDLGINRGTKWFVLSAVVVNEEDEAGIREAIHSLRQKLNLNELHFRNLRNFEQKCYAVAELSKLPFELVNVIVDTSKIQLTKTDKNSSPSIVSYNYCCRLLLERVSWLLRITNRRGNIFLSSRGTSRDGDLIAYINLLLSNEDNGIDNQFDIIKSMPASERDLLQLADVCATSVFYYHEPNFYGFVTPCYSYPLKSHIYSRNGNIDSYGMKYYSSEMKPNENYFLDKMICKNDKIKKENSR